MLSFIAQRLGMMVLVLAGLITVTFLMTQVLPGDPARAAAGRNATAEQVEGARERLGLDRPVPEQYVSYLGRVAQGDLGTSVFTQRPVSDDIGRVLPSSVELVGAAMLINIAVALPLGVVSAYRRGRAADLAARLVALLGAAVPVFWLGLILQAFLSARWGLFPLTGHLGFGASVPAVTGMTTVDALLAGDLAAFGDALHHLALPAVTLAASYIAVVTRTLRSTMIGALDADYITLARSTGASEWRVVLSHGLRNALVPTSTILGMQLGWMLGSTVLVESIFGRVGVGAYSVTAVLQNDLYAVIGAVLVIGVVFILANFVVDLLQLWLNPRLRRGGRRRRAGADESAVQAFDLAGERT
ncbi:peptide/nickel transport system permease protein [Nocardiopsis flavescens]|uniref:Peptide/nickel transport system permease protein n=1 Tax=Nocardiopsis flavescens TaxID=758803 RepID=A0A1M6CY85_9ACTN|nr:ABC transporter permease [Nocardiopsis flavescens]SHI65821.1 peptide/nickel transport system permease protein [Nocardiopsis flavescens]